MSDEVFVDIDKLKQNQKLAEQRVKELSVDEWKHLRRRAKTDLFFLSYGVLGYNKLSEGLHGHLCSWMMRNKAARFRMILLPRGHYKSTIVTLSDAIRIALPDDVGDLPWPECLGTDCRIALIHEGGEQSSKWIQLITSHFLSNTLLMALFPECVPSPREHNINKNQLELPRSDKLVESTFEAMSVGGKSQGRHYNFLKCDDLVGDKARDSKTEMDTAIQWFDGIEPYFVEFERDYLDLVGTRWAPRDLYSHILNSTGKKYLKYIRPAIERDAEGNEKPIFEEGFSLAGLREYKRTKPKLYAAFFDNNPEGESNEFQTLWLKFYEKHPSGNIIVFKGTDKLVFHPHQCDVNILLDPAMSGRSGLIVTGEYTNEDIFLLEALKEAWSPPELCNLVFQLVQRYRPRTVAIESVLFAGLFKNWFEAEMKLRGVRFHITPVNTKGKEKAARVRGLTNYFAAGRIYCHESQTDFIQEYKEFGETDDYHMLDALAYGPEIWRKPIDQKVWESYREVERQIMEGRDKITGYSPQ